MKREQRIVRVMVLGLVLAGALQSWGQTAWTNAVNGVWSDATKWTNGVPNLNAALLRAGSGSYTVTVDAVLTTLPTALTITNNYGNTTRLDIDAAGFVVTNGLLTLGRGALVSVNPGGEMLHPGTNTSLPFVSVVEGGEWLVNGGTVNFTDLRGNGVGRSYVYVGNSSTGRLTISSGLFDLRARVNMTETNSSVQLRVGVGAGSRGTMVMTGGRAMTYTYDTGGTASFAVGSGAGSFGELLLTNDAVMIVSNHMSVADGAGTRGFITLAGTSATSFQGWNTYGVSGGRAEVTVRDSAYFGASNQLYLGRAGSTGILNVAGGRYQAGGGASIGYGENNNWNSYGEVNVSGGILDIGGGYGYGLNVGHINGTNCYTLGVVNLSGTGVMRVLGMWNQAGHPLNGLALGRARQTAPFRTTWACGRLNMTGGTITNQGQYAVGAWPGGTGDVYQTGGDVWQRVCPLTVGWGGGTGLYHMAGGTFRSDRGVYVGGVMAIDIRADYPAATEFTNASAGTLKITGGDFQTSSNLVVGRWGDGRLVMGTNGLMQVGTLTLTNNGSSTLRFEFGPNGIGTLTVTNQLQIAAGAKLQVDMTGFKEQGWFKLVNCKTRSGSFDAANITVTGGAGEVVQTRDEDIYLRLTRGTLIYVK